MSRVIDRREEPCGTGDFNTLSFSFSTRSSDVGFDVRQRDVVAEAARRAWKSTHTQRIRESGYCVRSPKGGQADSRSRTRSNGGGPRALVVDLHTGMGDWGDCLYLPQHDPGTPCFDWRAAHFKGARESAVGRAILAEVRETSVPADPGWQRRVLVRGAAVLADACRALFERTS